MADILTITAALNVAFFGLNVAFFGLLSYVSAKIPGGEMVKRAAAVALTMLALNAVAFNVSLGLAR